MHFKKESLRDLMSKTIKLVMSTLVLEGFLHEEI